MAVTLDGILIHRMKCNYGTQNCQLFAGVLMELNLYQVEAVLKLKSTGWWWNILNRGINANRVTFFGSFMPPPWNNVVISVV
jgi:hypothetical protein